jgi:hypothetical protein
VNLIVQVMITIIETPIYVPFLTYFWKKYIAPGSGDLSILTLYTLIGAVPSTLFYKLYHRHDPFTENDLIALESNKIPQLFIYTWNHHPLTNTIDKHEINRRNAIFDWIPRMHTAYLLNAAAHSGFFDPAKIENPLTPEDFKFNRQVTFRGHLFKFLRCASVFLISTWVYPYSQLETADAAAIINDLKNAYVPVQFWWYGYQLGLIARLLAIFNYPVWGPMADTFYAWIVGGSQLLASHYMMFEIQKRTNLADWKRVAVNTAGFIAWDLDTFNLFTGVMPASPWLATTEAMSRTGMY